MRPGALVRLRSVNLAAKGVHVVSVPEVDVSFIQPSWPALALLPLEPNLACIEHRASSIVHRWLMLDPPVDHTLAQAEPQAGETGENHGVDLRGCLHRRHSRGPGTLLAHT